jgi:hypothetical protein
LHPELSSAASPVTLATSPHLGQAPASPSKEKRQLQKHATSVITAPSFSAPAAAWPTGAGSGTGALVIVNGRVLAVLMQQRRQRLLLSAAALCRLSAHAV